MREHDTAIRGGGCGGDGVLGERLGGKCNHEAGRGYGYAGRGAAKGAGPAFKLPDVEQLKSWCGV